jgi:BirA family biotin operon repressor/biotin-[acetyl-CoA-carboxylase] ligase
VVSSQRHRILTAILDYQHNQNPYIGKMIVMTDLTDNNGSADFLTPAAFVEHLGLALPGFGSVQWAQVTGSSNDDLSQRIKLGSTHAMPWLLGAHTQGAARGRAARPWHNQAGDTLMFSCAFEPNIALAQLPGLSPALGVAACLGLRQLFAPLLGQEACQRLALKWPNDLQWGAGKLAGILVETAQRPSARHPCLVVGIGLNLRGARALSTHLARDIADVSELLAIVPDSAGSGTVTLCPSRIVSTIAQAWQKTLDVYATTGYAAFQDLFHSVDALASMPVDVIDQGRVLQTGIARGTDSSGRLLVQTATAMVPILVGDVSVRGQPDFRSAVTLKGTQ